MAKFSYIAIDADGVEEKGTIEAISDFDVNEILNSRNLMTVEIEPFKDSKFSLGRNLPVNTSDRCLLLRQMAMMLRAGITLPAILPKIKESSHKTKIKAALEQIADEIQSGSTLSSAMRNQPQIFSPITCGVVESSETSGSLDEAFEKMAKVIEFWHKVRSKVIESLIYPVVILLVALGVSYLMFFNFIPKLETFLSASGKPLPEFTQFIFGISKFLKANFLTLLLIIISIFVAFYLSFRNPNGRRRIERLFFKVPVFGNLIRYSELSFFSSSMSSLIESGSSLISSLELVSGTSKSLLYRDWIQNVRESLLTGESLGDSLDERLIPLPAIAVIKAGETSGTLGKAFEELEEYLSSRLQALVGIMVSLVEPALLIFVGAIVGSVYFAMFMAIISLNSA